MSNKLPVAVGIDLGSAFTKVIALDEEGKVLQKIIEDTDPYTEKQAGRLLDGITGGEYHRVSIVATGYGRKLAKRSTRAVTEISCHAKGIFHEMGHGGTLIDIGGQDSKVIVISDTGAVLNFTMNDKCAAGTGRFLEVSANRLKIPIELMGKTALEAASEVKITSTCAVFAESEIVGLLAKGKPVDHIVRGLARSLVLRVAAMAHSLHPPKPFMLSGGVARSPAIRAFLAEALGQAVELPEEPQIIGALGAALMALDIHKGK